jgi:hypothetical protein
VVCGVQHPDPRADEFHGPRGGTGGYRDGARPLTRPGCDHRVAITALHGAPAPGCRLLWRR